MSTLGSPAGDVLTTRPSVLGSLRGLVLALPTLTKARLSALVLLTTAVGFILGQTGEGGWAALLWTVIGTALAAGCANTINQIIERRRDGRMQRTASRPLPAGRTTPLHAFLAAVVMGYTGVALLAILVNLLAAGLALLTILLYVLVYTPLKSRTTLNTLVGAVAGALPPMIGWAAATGSLDLRAIMLGALLFVWQLPHFFALAWLYREDYERGGYRMLPVLDPTGRITARVVVLTSMTLLPLGLALTMVGLTGWLVAAGSVLLGLAMVALGVRMARHCSSARARTVFLASLIYLPLLLTLMVIDRGSLLAQNSSPEHRSFASALEPGATALP